MAYQPILLGTAANDGTGDPIRTGGTKINANFLELYSLQFPNAAFSTHAEKIVRINAGGTASELAYNTKLRSTLGTAYIDLEASGKSGQLTMKSVKTSGVITEFINGTNNTGLRINSDGKLEFKGELNGTFSSIGIETQGNGKGFVIYSNKDINGYHGYIKFKTNSNDTILSPMLISNYGVAIIDDCTFDQHRTIYNNANLFIKKTKQAALSLFANNDRPELRFSSFMEGNEIREGCTITSEYLGGGTYRHNLVFRTSGTTINSISDKMRLGWNGDLNLLEGSYKVAGVSGVSGTFTTADSKTVTVTKGIITSIV